MAVSSPPVPVRIARDAGADFVIAVDVSSGPLNATPVGIYEQVMHSFDIMGRSLAKLETEQADVVIRPDTARIASTDFNARAAFIQIGQKHRHPLRAGRAGKNSPPGAPRKARLVVTT